MQILPGSANLIGGRGVTLKNVPSRDRAGDEVPGRPLRPEDGLRREPQAGLRRPRPGAVDADGQRRRLPRGLDPRRAPTERQARTSTGARSGRRDRRQAARSGTCSSRRWPACWRARSWCTNHCYRADEMAQVLDMGEEFGYKVAAFHHAVEAYKIADLLAREGICARDVGRLVGLQDRGLRRHPREHRAARTTPAPAPSSTPTRPRASSASTRRRPRRWRAGQPDRARASPASGAMRWITVNPAKALGIDE